MNVLGVIPARGGSKGIPRKNMRLMNGKPLIRYAIDNALACNDITDVVVTSDSEEVRSYASGIEGVVVLDRSSELAQDAVTLDPVIYDATVRMEALRGHSYDAVVTLQATSPLLTPQTLSGAMRQFEKEDIDSLISVVNAPHLTWRESSDGGVEPNYKKRLNRQQLPANYLETGAFFIARRSYVTSSSRLGEKISVYEVPEVEATDIDSPSDWVVCESLLKKKTIVFRADGYKELGLGHISRVLTLGYEFPEHNITFVTNVHHKEGLEKLRMSNMPVVSIEDDADFFEWLKEVRPDVLVNDTLDTTREYVMACKEYAKRVVTFEDLGSGTSEADAVINAIYEKAPKNGNVYTGKRYVCLRDEFLISSPSKYSEDVKRILIMFGGTDPLDLSRRLYNLAKRMNDGQVRVVFDFVLGSGYASKDLKPIPERGIEVSRDISRVSDHMARADLAVSSQGRTTFELASMGVPTIVLAQNPREQLHSFAQMDNGFINLGLGSEVSDDDIASALEWLMGASSVRREMHRLMLSNDLKSGIGRVKQIILGELV